MRQTVGIEQATVLPAGAGCASGPPSPARRPRAEPGTSRLGRDDPGAGAAVDAVRHRPASVAAHDLAGCAHRQCGLIPPESAFSQHSESVTSTPQSFLTRILARQRCHWVASGEDRETDMGPLQ